MDQNQEKNIQHYDGVYANKTTSSILWKLDNLTEFLHDATRTDTSWVGLYYNNFQGRLKGKKVLELGCGDCTNAAVMAALGAEVYANDIAPRSGEIIEKLNSEYEFSKGIKFIEGDFLEADLGGREFDFVIGKAFLHHLEMPKEQKFLIKIAGILKDTGEARFLEPAVNSLFLDSLRWYTPVGGRPSKFNTEAFKTWKLKDPHPERDNSSCHFEEMGKKLFKEVEIIPIGVIERFHKVLPAQFDQRKFRRRAFLLEKYLPAFINRKFARTQAIIYRFPRRIE